jgi:hypothetical protein
MKTTSIDQTLKIRPEANGSKKIQTVLVMLLAAITLSLLSGCSSVPAAGPDQSKYNFDTEYPAVGSGWPWHSNL